jgi:hypothetical protein
MKKSRVLSRQRRIWNVEIRKEGKKRVFWNSGKQGEERGECRAFS